MSFPLFLPFEHLPLSLLPDFRARPVERQLTSTTPILRAIFSANGTSAEQTPNCTFEEHQTPPAEWKNGDTYYWNAEACTLPEFSFAPSELQVFA